MTTTTTTPPMTTPTNPTSRRTSQTIRSEPARVLQPSQDGLEHLAERRGLLAVHLVEDQPPDGGYMPGRRGFDRRAARGGQHDVRAAPVTGTVLPDDEPASAHARQHVRESALLPVQGQAELERAELALGRLAELHEHLVLGQREPAISLKQPVQPGGQQRSGA